MRVGTGSHLMLLRGIDISLRPSAICFTPTASPRFTVNFQVKRHMAKGAIILGKRQTMRTEIRMEIRMGIRMGIRMEMQMKMSTKKTTTTTRSRSPPSALTVPNARSANSSIIDASKPQGIVKDTATLSERSSSIRSRRDQENPFPWCSPFQVK